MMFIQPCWVTRLTLFSLGILLPLLLLQAQAEDELFNIVAIRDTSTLEAKVISDWAVSAKEPTIRQKLIEITVCEWWPGETVRLPVTLNAPADGSVCQNLIIANQGLVDRATLPTKGQLTLMKEHGVGVVLIGMSTIDKMKPVGKLHLGMKERLLATKNPRYTVAWVWGMSQMRALTAAMSEPEVFQPEKILTTGGSKRGVAATVAGIVDDRFTAILPVVAPIMGNPGTPSFVEGAEPERILRANEAFLEKADPGHAQAFRERAVRRSNHRITLEQAKAAVWNATDIESMTDLVWDVTRITNFLPEVKARGLDYFWNVGTNDSVSPALLEVGKQYPEFPLCIIPSGQHGGPATAGYTTRVPTLPEVEANFLSFALYHFKRARSMPGPPIIVVDLIENGGVKVTAVFPDGLKPEMNELSFVFNRNEPYTLAFEFDEWSTVEMARKAPGVYEAEIALPNDVSVKSLDLVTVHRHVENGLPITFSGPYQRVDSFE
jgi:hypothetical protein